MPPRPACRVVLCGGAMLPMVGVCP